MNKDELIYDWNTQLGPEIPAGRRVMLDDETLRDGLQNPSVRDPSISEKIEILHLMEALGIETVNIGLPGAGPRAFADTEALAREIARARMKIRPNCAARTHKDDITPVDRNFAARGHRASRRPHFWARARFAGWWRIGRSII